MCVCGGVVEVGFLVGLLSLVRKLWKHLKGVRSSRSLT